MRRWRQKILFTGMIDEYYGYRLGPGVPERPV